MRVGLVGATGHGGWHRRTIAALAETGLVELVGLADVAPVPDADVPVYGGHHDLLAEARPDVVVVCTPPHTHRPIATDALRAGADVLLEKPPVLDLAEHAELAAVVAETGRACQVGFQALGSLALRELRATMTAGGLGEITGIAARGAWVRPDSYFRRAPWVGRRALDGHPVLDGALVNPFAHALMQVLALADSPVTTVDVELFQAHDIEVDDTACVRLRFASGVTGLVAVTLCAEEFVAGDITVTGTGGKAVLEYPTDRLWLPGRDEQTYGRDSLLANLVAHREDGTPLLVPLERTRPFTALLAPILAATPVRVDARASDPVVIPGINALIDEAVAGLALFSELRETYACEGSEVRA